MSLVANRSITWLIADQLPKQGGGQLPPFKGALTAPTHINSHSPPQLQRIRRPPVQPCPPRGAECCTIAPYCTVPVTRSAIRSPGHRLQPTLRGTSLSRGSMVQGGCTAPDENNLTVTFPRGNNLQSALRTVLVFGITSRCDGE